MFNPPSPSPLAITHTPCSRRERDVAGSSPAFGGGVERSPIPTKNSIVFVAFGGVPGRASRTRYPPGSSQPFRFPRPGRLNSAALVAISGQICCVKRGILNGTRSFQSTPSWLCLGRRKFHRGYTCAGRELSEGTYLGTSRRRWTRRRRWRASCPRRRRSWRGACRTPATTPAASASTPSATATPPRSAHRPNTLVASEF